jgi:glycosyltransferase involved in cell wall biosynthesis
VPVLTTDVGFGRELVGADGERGWVIPPYDAPALAAALRRLLAEAIDWPPLRRRCRRYVERQTIEEWAREIERLCAGQWGVPLAAGAR